MKNLALICLSLALLVVSYLFIQGQRSASLVTTELAYNPAKQTDVSRNETDSINQSNELAGHSQASNQPSNSASIANESVAQTNLESQPSTKEQMFTGLRHKYAVGQDTQQKPLWQMQTLDDLRGIFQQRFGEDWLEELTEFLRIAFPELADQLTDKINALVDYEQWTEELATMTFSSVDARQDALWGKRYELFGDEAESIWISEHQNRLINTGLKALEYRGDFQEQRLQYQTLLEDVYGEDEVPNQPQAQMNQSHNFLSLKGVQDNLHAMSADTQIDALRELRQDLGLDEAALDRLAALDQQRAVTWEKGMRYEELRKSVADSVASEQQLLQLRVELFGETEAEFIKSEETAGFYRFQDRQKIGVN